MADICSHFNSMDDTQTSLIFPRNYIDNCYNVYAECKSSGYIEYVAYLLNSHYHTFDSKILFTQDIENANRFGQTLYQRLNSKEERVMDDKWADQQIKGVNRMTNDQSIDLFISFHTIKESELEKREQKWCKLTIVDIYIMLNTISDQNASAIFKVYDSFNHRSNELVFLIHKCFDNQRIIKSSLQQKLKTHKYIVCENYRPKIGNQISQLIKAHLNEYL